MPTRPVLYFDLASPEAYLVAERATEALGAVPEWRPIQLAALPGARLPGAAGAAAEREAYRTELERRAAGRQLQPMCWPPGWPNDTALAMRVATYAQSIGRVVAFSLAAFRQAFAAGRDLSDPDSVLIAAAACEMHPAAVLKAAETRGVAAALARATTAAAAAGVLGVPAVGIGARIFHGDEQLEAAAAALRGTRAA